MNKDNEARRIEKLEQKFAEKFHEELENYAQETEDFERKEKEYREEVEAMRKQHATELDAKTSVIISLQDRIRFLEGKPMSTGTDTHPATEKETVSFRTRVSEPNSRRHRIRCLCEQNRCIRADQPTRTNRQSRIGRKPGPKRRQKTGGWRKFRTRHTRRVEGLRNRQEPGKRVRKTTTVPDSNVPRAPAA